MLRESREVGMSMAETEKESDAPPPQASRRCRTRGGGHVET